MRGEEGCGEDLCGGSAASADTLLMDNVAALVQLTAYEKSKPKGSGKGSQGGVPAKDKQFLEP